MDCKAFRNNHAYFIDDMLPGVTTWAMRDHMKECAACATLDSQLRRALMLARNAPSIELSPEFERRLSARLAAERLAFPVGAAEARPRTRGRMFAAAAALLLAAGVGTSMMVRRAPEAIVASQPAATHIVSHAPATMATPVALPETPSAGTTTMLPAVFLAQRATAQFAAARSHAQPSAVTH